MGKIGFGIDHGVSFAKDPVMKRNGRKCEGLVLFAFLMTFFASITVAQAPGWSRGQQNLAIGYDDCVRRMSAALQNEGYNKDPNSGGNFVAGTKDIHTAVIICSPAPESKILVQIVVASNGPGGGSERQCLQSQMENPGASKCGAKRNCNTPVGSWNWWNGTTVTFFDNLTVSNSTGLTGRWRLESGSVNVAWSNGVNASYSWVGDGQTMTEIYNGTQQTMRRYGPCGN